MSPCLTHQEFLLLSKCNLITHWSASPSPLIPLLSAFSANYHSINFYSNSGFSVWLISLTIIIFSFIHVTSHVLFFCFFFLIQGSVDGHSGYFCFLVIMNTAAVNVNMECRWLFIITDFIFIGYTGSSVIARSHGSYTLNSVRNFLFAFAVVFLSQGLST